MKIFNNSGVCKTLKEIWGLHLARLGGLSSVFASQSLV